MPNTTTTSNMNLALPNVGQETGPQWATDVNQALTQVDSHNHSAGQGVPVGAPGISLQSDLTFNSFNATSLRTSRYSAFGAGTLATSGTDLGCVYVSGTDLYYNNTNGVPVQITSGSTIIPPSSGNIVGLTPPAAATYVPSSAMFVFTSSGTTPAFLSGAGRVVTKTASYSIDLNDATVLVSIASSGFPVSLPDATICNGKSVTIKKTDTSSSAITINSVAGTIDGNPSLLLATKNDEATFVSNGSNWFTTQRHTDTPWTVYPLTIGATIPPTTGITAVTNQALWRRVGDSMEVMFNFYQTIGGTAGVGAYLFPLPQGYAADTSKITVSTNLGSSTQLPVGGHYVGSGWVSNTAAWNSNNAAPMFITMQNATNFVCSSLSGAAVDQGAALAGNNNKNLSSNTLSISFNAKVPILNWSA